MNNSVNDFIDKYYNESVELKKRFKIAEKKSWNIFTILSEFYVQLGHLSLLISDYKLNAEKNRKINDIDDEISDVIFQLINIDHKLNNSLMNKEYNYKLIILKSASDYILNINILIGQLSESLLESNKYRHYKIRYDYPNINDYIDNLLHQSFELIYSLCIYLNININESYANMIVSANNFLKKYSLKNKIEYYPIVDVHATWLVLNPIQGCPKKCQYCFLAEKGLNSISPIILCSPKEAVDSLLTSRYYIKDMPLCLLSQTDAFSTEENIEYLKQLIYYLKQANIENPIVMITKCLIPSNFINYIKDYENKGMKFIFFLSYSGLDSTIEKGVNHEDIKNNFINLKKYNIDVVHYWRPFIINNSSKEKILEVYNFVRKYASCSVAIGLKTTNAIINNMEWKELNDNREEALKSDNIWNKKAYEIIWNSETLNNDYPIYQTTSCALCCVLKKPDFKFFFNTDICKCNKCTKDQRNICKNKIINSVTKDEIVSELDKIGYLINHNDIEIKNEKVYLKNISINLKDISYLTEKFLMQIIVNKNSNDYYWNTSINSSKILLIE